mmetsp:Transcript_11072/g.16694  ORF Transcript_11072/g.16694 Transcript_11072/m.16694 type:complete len:138 (+) Transcript_11072:18-431(+)
MLYTAQAFRGLKSVPALRTISRNMITITDGVEFDTIAREWRMKWSAEDNKKSLASTQQTLSLFQPSIAKIDGVKSVQRIVCGGCLDYKVIIALPAEKFAAWEAAGFAPEADFLAALKAIPGITQLETQTYTLMPVGI